MKKLFSLILVFALVFALSVNAFANSLFDNRSLGNIDKGDGFSYVGVLGTSLLDDAAKDFMRDYFSVLTGKSDSDDYFYIFSAELF